LAITLEELKDLYWNQKKSQREIAEEFNCNRSYIRYWMKKFNIPLRTISEARKGKGRKQLEGSKRKISETLKGKYINEKSWKWKGDNVKYFGLHMFIRKHKPKPERCEICGEKDDFIELSNISGEYKRDINDFQYICRKCHHIEDVKNHPRNKLGQFINNEVTMLSQ